MYRGYRCRPKNIDIRLLRKAKKIVIVDRRTSISYLQRKLGIGYDRARVIMVCLTKRYKKLSYLKRVKNED